MVVGPGAWLRSFLGGGFRRLANELAPLGPSGRSMDGALRRLAGAGIRTVVDVGASNGRWSLAARRHFPGASFLLVEAQAEAHGAALERLRRRWPEVDLVLAAAGDRVGAVTFDARDPLGGVAGAAPGDPGSRTVPMTTLDAELDRRSLAGPYLLKLDTHGFEIPILEGARRTLPQARALVIEAYNFRVSGTALRFHELSAWLEQRGFRCADLVDVLHRPRDGALWQMDLVFVPVGAPEFGSEEYR